VTPPHQSWVPPTEFYGSHTDLTTTDGEVLKDVTIKRIEPDGIIVTFADGIKKIYFKDLPADVAHKYGYEPNASAKFSAELQRAQVAAQAAYQAEALRKANEAAIATAQKNIAEAQQAIIQSQNNALKSQQAIARQAASQNRSRRQGGLPMAGSQDVKVKYNAYGQPYTSVDASVHDDN
jgi:hypothetical protein